MRQGAEVFGIDRRLSSSRSTVGEGETGSFRFFQGELSEAVADAELFLKSVPSKRRGIFHMAGLADAKLCFKRPDLAFDSHVRSTFNLLELCRRIGGATFVYPSTGLVYSQSIEQPSKEDDLVVEGSVYVSMKLSAESLVRLYAQHYSIRCIIARLANTYGPGMSENTVIGRILSQASKKLPIRVRESTSIRDFIFSEDVVEALLRLYARVGERDGLIVNVSTGIGHSIETVVSEAARLFNLAYEAPEQCHSDSSGGSRLVLSNEKIRHLTGWAPKTTLAEGLQKSLVDEFTDQGSKKTEFH